MAVTNAQRQYVRSLRQLKARRKYGTFAVEGLTNVRELLTSDLTVTQLYATADAVNTLRPSVDPSSTNLYEVGQKELERLSSQKSPHGALAVVRQPAHDPQILAKAARVLFLDDLADPGNVGTLVRTAEWFGVEAIVASPASVDWYNPKLVASARGSLFRAAHFTMQVEELRTAVGADAELVVADLHGLGARAFAWPQRTVLCLGSESRGPSERLLGLSPKPVTIERAASAKTESLNVAVAGSILCALWR